MLGLGLGLGVVLGLGEQQEQNNNKAQSLTACVCARVYVCVCGHWLFLFVYATPGAHVSTSLTNVCLTPRVALCQPPTHTHTHKRRQQHIENVAQGNQLKLKPHTSPPPAAPRNCYCDFINDAKQNKKKLWLCKVFIRK